MLSYPVFRTLPLPDVMQGLFAPAESLANPSQGSSLTAQGRPDPVLHRSDLAQRHPAVLQKRSYAVQNDSSEVLSRAHLSQHHPAVSQNHANLVQNDP